MTDSEIKEVTTKFVAGLLWKKKSRGMCFMVCAPLQGFLAACGVETKLISGEITFNEGGLTHIWDHYWLRLPSGKILDPTANQFKAPNGKQMPAIFMGKKPRWYKNPKWHSH